MTEYIMRNKRQEEAERIARSIVDERQKERERNRPHKHTFRMELTGGTNKGIKTCTVCGHVRVVQWTNEQSRQIMKSLPDLAQPGSELYKKHNND